jgi:hypothetical protein
MWMGKNVLKDVFLRENTTGEAATVVWQKWNVQARMGYFRLNSFRYVFPTSSCSTPILVSSCYFAHNLLFLFPSLVLAMIFLYLSTSAISCLLSPKL